MIPRPRLNEAAHDVLMALADGNDYAHAIARTLGRPANGGVQYILTRLIDLGLVQDVGQYRGPETRARLRRRYVLTRLGACVVRAERAADECYARELAEEGAA